MGENETFILLNQINVAFYTIHSTFKNHVAGQAGSTYEPTEKFLENQAILEKSGRDEPLLLLSLFLKDRIEHSNEIVGTSSFRRIHME